MTTISSKSEDVEKYQTGLKEATKPRQTSIWKFGIKNSFLHCDVKGYDILSLMLSDNRIEAFK